MSNRPVSDLDPNSALRNLLDIDRATLLLNKWEEVEDDEPMDIDQDLYPISHGDDTSDAHPKSIAVAGRNSNSDSDEENQLSKSYQPTLLYSYPTSTIQRYVTSDTCEPRRPLVLPIVRRRSTSTSAAFSSSSSSISSTLSHSRFISRLCREATSKSSPSPRSPSTSSSSSSPMLSPSSSIDLAWVRPTWRVREEIPPTHARHQVEIEDLCLKLEGGILFRREEPRRTLDSNSDSESRGSIPAGSISNVTRNTSYYLAYRETYRDTCIGVETFNSSQTTSASPVSGASELLPPPPPPPDLTGGNAIRVHLPPRPQFVGANVPRSGFELPANPLTPSTATNAPGTRSLRAPASSEMMRSPPDEQIVAEVPSLTELHIATRTSASRERGGGRRSSHGHGRGRGVVRVAGRGGDSTATSASPGPVASAREQPHQSFMRAMQEAITQRSAGVTPQAYAPAPARQQA
ncbi:hypothetical protein IAT40_007052 [Kwoniella sp. CBS 6097]